MGLVTREPEALTKHVLRESLLEMKKASDEHASCTGSDLFTEYGVNPAELFQEERVSGGWMNIGGQQQREMTIEEPSSTDFYQYGLEVKYLPLYRYLQVSRKAVLSDDWRVARDELLFSKAFDRLLELRSAKSLSLVLPRRQAAPPKMKFKWDGVLEEARWMWLDVEGEGKWKRSLACKIAYEAVDFLKLRCGSASGSNNTGFYSMDLLNYLDRDTLVYEGHLMAPEDVQEHLSKTHKQWLDGLNALTTLLTLEQTTNGLQPTDLAWDAEEDSFLVKYAQVYSFNYALLGNALNRSAHDCNARLNTLKNSNMDIDQQQTLLTSQASKHHILSSAMLGSSCKLIARRPQLQPATAAKKLAAAASSSHPSHDTAVRKANQNINKLLTPSELALRRLQRNRLGGSGMGGGELSPGVGNSPAQSPRKLEQK